MAPSGAERHQGRLRHVLLPPLGIEPTLDDALGEALQLQVEGAAQRQVAGGTAEQAAHVGGRHVDEVVGAGRRLGWHAQVHGLGSRRLRLLRRDRPGLDHGLEDGVGPLLGAAEIARRGELGRRPHQAGEHGGFGEGELLRRLGEVAPCGRIDPVGAGAEIGGVQVAQEDLLLAELALQPEGDDRLLDLAAQVLVGRQEHQARQLLGDGAAALARAAGLPVAPGGPQDAPWIDAVVAVEPSVLDGHDGLGKVGGHVGCRDLGRP